MAASKPHKILLVAGPEAMPHTLDSDLANEQAEFIMAYSESEAMVLARRRGFALMILDPQTPGLDSQNLMRKLKALPSTLLTQIIFLSSKPLAREAELKAYQMSVAEVIATSMAPEVLHAKIQFFIDLYDQRVNERENS